MISVTEVQKAYLAYFGRPADPVGLEYWMNSDIATMRAGFAASAEYATLYSGMTSEQRVEQVYQNLLGRASDPEGKAYWVNEFNAGRETISSLVVSMQTNALGIDIGTINNRVTYAILFTAQLDTPAEVVDYSGTAVADRARTDMAAVTYTDASLATARANITGNSVTVLGSAPPAPTPDTTAPTMISAVVATNGQSIVVTYSEALTGTAELGDYAVTLSANTTTVTGASIGVGADANKVTLTLSNTIVVGVNVTDLVYTAAAGTANSIKDAASNSAATQTLATVTNGSTSTVLNFLLTTTNGDTFTGGAGDDIFTGTYGNGAGPYTMNAGDTLDGAGGNDTLRITTGAEASTPGDGLWANTSNFEIMEFESTGAGAQVVTTGANFAAAFANGADLSVTTLLGAIDVTMTGYLDAATINTTTTGAGAHTIVTGTGAATVNATGVAAGDQTINGVGLTTVTATVAGAGNQTIGTTTSGNLVTVNATVSGAGFQEIKSTSGSNVTVVASAAAGAQTITTAGGNDSVTLTTAAGQLTTIITGAGTDTIVASLGTDTITGGTGADSINLGVDVAVDTVTIAVGDSLAGAGTFDVISNFIIANDILNLPTTTIMANGTATGIASGTLLDHQVTAGLIEFDDAGTGFAAAVIINAANVTDAIGYCVANVTGVGESVMFQYDLSNNGSYGAGDGVFVFQNGATDTLVFLTGLDASTHTKLAAAVAANTVVIS